MKEQFDWAARVLGAFCTVAGVGMVVIVKMTPEVPGGHVALGQGLTLAIAGWALWRTGRQPQSAPATDDPAKPKQELLDMLARDHGRKK